MTTAYQAQIVSDLPEVRQVEFGVPGGLGEVSLQVLVEPEVGEPWIGNFRTLGYSDVNELFVWRNSSKLLAIARGYPHYVSASEPEIRTELPIFPVRHVLDHQGLVILVGFERLCGVDGEGVRWVSASVASDWIEEPRIEGDLVLGRGNVPATGGWLPFSVSITDGSTETDWKSTR